MKKLGLVGGTGPESTVLYYRRIIEGIGEREGSRVIPKITIDSLSPFEVFDMFEHPRFDDLTGYLLASIENLAAAHVEVASLTGITPHVVFPDLQAASPVPLVSAISATCDAAVAAGYTRIGLLGTEFTMREHFFGDAFAAAGIDVVVPEEATLRLVHHRIESELELGRVKDSTRQEFLGIADEMHRKDGVEAIILGCTELPLLFTGMDVEVPLLDVVELHTRALIDAI
ncbi:amino acid racemase [Acidipropionibacterium jensenii]|uniref:aspartate/glutamate racemase family protein n=1 Tax=Acidipropionibacterium jensenii TaxID=1749 RepID=UPI00110C0BC0|nr:amino acid racemase [Acidipropionibacterium jensenii]QCV88482.1 amino acid racemase [Acidipropionibacterium jensenii]